MNRKEMATGVRKLDWIATCFGIQGFHVSSQRAPASPEPSAKRRFACGEQPIAALWSGSIVVHETARRFL
jgi:hypothetical protein